MQRKNQRWDIPNLPLAYFDEMVLEDAVVAMHTEWHKFFSNEDWEFRRHLGTQQLEQASYILRARIRRLLGDKKLVISCSNADEVNLVQNILDLDRPAQMSFYVDKYFKRQIFFFDGGTPFYIRVNLSLARIDVISPPGLHDSKHYSRLLCSRNIRARQNRSTYETDSFSILEENAWRKATARQILSNCFLTALALGYPMSRAIYVPVSQAIVFYLAHYVYYRKRNGRVIARRADSIRRFLMQAGNEIHTYSISASLSNTCPQAATELSHTSLEWNVDSMDIESNTESIVNRMQYE